MNTLINQTMSVICTAFFVCLANVLAKIMRTELDTVLLILLVAIANHIRAVLKDMEEGK